MLKHQKEIWVYTKGLHMLQELHMPLVENVLRKSTVLNDSLVTYTEIVLTYFTVYYIT